MSIPQLKAVERAAIRIRAMGSLEHMAALNAALAGSFGSGDASKEYTEKLREIAATGRP